MRKAMLPGILVLLGLLLVLPACNGGGGGGSSDSGTGGQVADVAKSNLDRDTSPEVDAADVASLVAGNTDFAMDMFETLVASTDRNLFFSPYSMSLCFGMLYGGARTSTEQQMKQVFHFDLDQDTLHAAFNSLDLDLRPDLGTSRDDEAIDFRLEIANSFWGEQTYTFLDSYLDLLAVNYGAEIRLADFLNNAEGARQEINQWTSDATEGLIPELFTQGSISPNTVLALVNAIYFKAAWKEQFDEQYTTDAPFYTPSGEVTVPMMCQSGSFNYVHGEDFRAIEVPYKDDNTSLLLLLPDEGSYDLFEQSLNREVLDSIVGSLEDAFIALYLPRFTSRPDTLNLGNILPFMGMPIAFNYPGADFSGIDGIANNLFIATAMHQAVVTVDETGTEAAAATGIGMGAGVPFPVRFDRPFIYLIRDNPTGTVLFMGRMLDPTEG